MLPLACGLAALTGCSTLDAVNPVNWWHSAEGGPIAEQRPPPPNADAPYPNLGDAPTKVPAPDAARRAEIASGLVADRANAQYDATLSPLSAAPTPVKPVAPIKPAAAGDESSGASLAAANAPPAPAVARAVPATPVQSVPLASPEAAPPANPMQSAGPAGAETAAAAPQPDMPVMPEAPPAPPALAGVPGVTAPTPPPPTPKPPPPVKAALVLGAPVAVAFPPGSSLLPSDSLAGLKLLARTRGKGVVAITGYGEAKSATPDAQQSAMPLAMARVRSIAAYLMESGVPSSALRIDGEAQGTGAVARLLK